MGLDLEEDNQNQGEDNQTGGQGEEDLSQDWSLRLLEERDKADRHSRQVLGRVEKSTGVKRLQTMTETEGAARKRSRRLKYRRISEDWGEDEIDTKKMSFLQSGLEGKEVLPLSSGVQVTVTPAGKLDRAECGRRGVAKSQVAVQSGKTSTKTTKDKVKKIRKSVDHPSKN